MSFSAFLFAERRGKMYERTRRINEMLHEKVEAEYQNFLEELEKKEPKEIIASSYEKVFKEDIVLALTENELPYDRAKALLRMDYPLEGAYQAWLKQDVTYMEDLRDCVDDYAKRVCEKRREEKER